MRQQGNGVRSITQIRKPDPFVERVISGGQTGVDRAALDVALALGLPCGGWCPRGRRAEDGRIPGRYPLREALSTGYAQRTEWNVRDADAVLVLYRGRLRGGTALTVAVARRLGRPCLTVDLAGEPDPVAIAAWIAAHAVATLDVAGSRESHEPGIAAQARALLGAVLAR
jgi:hypothetical protein